MGPADITMDDGRPDVAGAVALHPAVLCEDKALHPLTKVLDPAVQQWTLQNTRQLKYRSSSFAAVHVHTRGVARNCKLISPDPCLRKAEVHAILLRTCCSS
jgi:hypothetical protein